MIKFKLNDDVDTEVKATLEVDEDGLLVLKVNGVDIVYLTPNGTLIRSFMSRREVDQVPFIDVEFIAGDEDINDYYKIIEDEEWE